MGNRAVRNSLHRPAKELDEKTLSIPVQGVLMLCRRIRAAEGTKKRTSQPHLVTHTLTLRARLLWECVTQLKTFPKLPLHL